MKELKSDLYFGGRGRERGLLRSSSYLKRRENEEEGVDNEGED